MALNWLAVIPWATLIENAPRILDASRKLFKRTQDVPAAPAPEIVINPTGGTEDRLATLERVADEHYRTLGELEQRQDEAVRLLDALAQQNAQLTLRLRRQAWVVTALVVVVLILLLRPLF